MITPSRWLSGGKGLDAFRKEMLNDRHIRKMIDYINAKDCFPQNSVGGGVNYFLWDTRETDDTSLGHANTGNEVNEGDPPIVTRFYLFLSGTPFRALNSGEFIEEQIYNWTYDAAEFVLKDYVQKWLDLIRGAYSPVTTDNLRLGTERPALPYSDTRLLRVLNHTLWYLPRVNSCYAMRNLLREPQNAFFHDYTVNVCAGTEAGVGMAALDKVRETMNDPLYSQTITLTCGKLTTGVTVKPWCGIFMLTNMRSPESYFQAAFRVQSP